MSMPGRKPKPIALRILEGNREHRSIPENTAKPRPVKPKKAPWLDKIARREWNRMCKLLGPLGLLSEIDGAALGVYCQAFSRLKQAEDIITQEGMTYKTPTGQIKYRPEVMIARAMMNMLKKFAIEFGMTPSSRSRIPVMPDDEEENEDLD